MSVQHANYHHLVFIVNSKMLGLHGRAYMKLHCCLYRHSMLKMPRNAQRFDFLIFQVSIQLVQKVDRAKQCNLNYMTKIDDMFILPTCHFILGLCTVS